MVPGIESRIIEGSDEAIAHVADLVRRTCLTNAATLTISQIQKGASSARSDDTKSLKGAVLDWITPRGQPLSPPLTRNVKVDRGYHHEHTGVLLCPAGLDWSNAEYAYLTVTHYILQWYSEQKRSYAVGKWRSLETSGRFSFITGTIMILKTLGMVYSEALYSYQ